MYPAKERFYKYLYILPLLALLAVIYIHPIIRAFYFSFFNLPFGTAKGVFIGLKNYINLFKDTVFLQALGNSFFWALGNLILQNVFAVFIAVMMNQKFKGRNIVRSLVLMPWIVPVAAIAVVMRWAFLPNLGMVNEVLLKVGVIKEAINFFGSKLAMPTLIVINSWKSVPIGILLVLSALQTIPQGIYEASEVDGASKLQQFFYLTFPMISSMLWFTGFIIFVFSFNTFDLIWMITQGGPGGTTQTLPILVYRTAFKSLRLGESSAIAIIIAIILIVGGLIFFKIAAPREEK